jgi:pilus assembly protein CpaC
MKTVMFRPSPASAGRRDRRSGAYDRRRNARALLRACGVVLATSIAAAILPSFVSGAWAERSIQIVAAKHTAAVGVPIGKSEDVRTDASFIDILVGDPDIADVNPLTDRALSILGKKIGTTRVSLYGEGKKLVGVFDIEVSYDTTKLAEELAQRFPQAKVRVSTANGRVLLSGHVPDGIVLDSILSVAHQFGPEIINSLQVAQPQQVVLEVRFVEAARTAGRQLGVQWNMFNRGTNTRFIGNIGDGVSNSQLPVTNGQVGGGGQPNVTSTSAGGLNVSPNALTVSPFVSAGVLSAASPFGFLVGKLLGAGIEADVLVNALETKGLARSLAEPNLVALSGDTANFLAGGEYPIPVPGAFGQISVVYKRYGVSLAFTPTVLDKGLINIKIEPEVSQLDPANSVAVGNGISVPALTVRRASSTIELRDGQSFVLAGLLQNGSIADQQQLPWIGDVPVLGALFSSKSYQKNETDLIIIVTPRVVRPTRPGDPIKTPLDNTLPANDIDFFLFGKSEVARRENRRGEKGYGHGEIGHMLDLPKGENHASLQ